MAANKFLNWTKPKNTSNVYWPGIIHDDQYIEDIEFGGGSTDKYARMTMGGGSPAVPVNNCTGNYNFIRVFKIQPTTHKMVIQFHITTGLAQGRKHSIGVFGTIDGISDDALWCRVPDSGMPSATTQHPTNSDSANETNISYNPFGVLTTTSQTSLGKGDFFKASHPTATDVSATTNDLLFHHDGNGAVISTVGSYGQLILNVDQLGYDYIAVRINNNSSTTLTTGGAKFIVRQFN